MLRQLAIRARLLRPLAAMVLVSCGTGPAAVDRQPGPTPDVLAVESIVAAYAGYTVERAAREGYRADGFCVDASAFGLPPSRGAMGFHSTNDALLRGPIDPQRPQALMFDASGRVLGVEYEVLADAVPAPPQLFGRTFTRLPSHPGVTHAHYALHLWFVENPEGRFADFNPRVNCPAGTGGPGAPQTLPPPEHGEGH
jgi:hypothetical protein